MSSIFLSSQSMQVLATAMAAAVSAGTVILLAFRLQKYSTTSSLNSCIISSSDDGKKKEKRKKMHKKVHFAEDVVDPIGNSDEYRKLHKRSNSSFKLTKIINDGKVKEMPANRVVLYDGILRDRINYSANFHVDQYC